MLMEEEVAKETRLTEFVINFVMLTIFLCLLIAKNHERAYVQFSLFFNCINLLLLVGTTLRHCHDNNHRY